MKSRLNRPGFANKKMTKISRDEQSSLATSFSSSMIPTNSNNKLYKLKMIKKVILMRITTSIVKNHLSRSNKLVSRI
jgi:hypothetical protein